MEKNIRYILYSFATLLFTLWISCSIPNRIQANEKTASPFIEWAWLDARGNQYTIPGHKWVRQFQAEGESVVEYSKSGFGNIHSADFSDPYKILLFYRDQQKIVLLDNALGELAVLDLGKLEGHFFTSAIHATDGDFWLWDAHSLRLIKIDDQFRIRDESFPVYQEGFPDFKGEYLLRNGKDLLVADPAQGVLWFDELGNFYRHLPVTGFTFIQLHNNLLVYSRDLELWLYDLSLYEGYKWLTLESETPVRLCLDWRTGFIHKLDMENRIIERIPLAKN